MTISVGDDGTEVSYVKKAEKNPIKLKWIAKHFLRMLSSRLLMIKVMKSDWIIPLKR